MLISARLVSAAAALITERGPQGFSLREVARRARVSEAAPYWHFPSKEALLAAVAAHPSLHAAGKRAFGLLVTTIAEAQRAGDIRRGDPEDLAVSAWALVHGLSALLIDGQLGERVASAHDAETLASRVTKLLQTGLARR